MRRHSKADFRVGALARIGPARGANGVVDSHLGSDGPHDYSCRALPAGGCLASAPAAVPFGLAWS
jgi:hypothetical protein